jgi:hypothetical protein
MRLIVSLLAAALCITTCLVPAIAYEKVPEATLKIQSMSPEKSVSTWIASESAGSGGLAVNVIYPLKPRYKEGAPLTVVVPGGVESSGLEFSTHSAQSGFAEVRFAFPGGGKQGFASGGVYDFRGPNCQAALRDVLLFASGKGKDIQGKTISELVPEKLDTKSVGIIGWSNGGNTAVITLAKFADQLKFVNWLVFYETPLGSIFYPPALGSAQDLIQNRHYHQGSAATGHVLVDYRKLCWQPTGQRNPGAHKKIGQPEIPGVVFFDENGNKQWDEEIEFALPYSMDAAMNKQIYPPTVTQSLARLKVFPDGWPKTVANVAQSEKYFQDRDGSLYINDLAKQMPNLFVCIFASVLDHLQRQPDHPHISLNYNAWLADKVRFVRLNPDPVYVGTVATMNRGTFVDNKPNASIDASTIEEFLEPEGLIPDYVYVEAAAAELADRKKTNNLAETLTEPLVTYWNGALAPPAQKADTGKLTP